VLLRTVNLPCGYHILDIVWGVWKKRGQVGDKAVYEGEETERHGCAFVRYDLGRLGLKLEVRKGWSCLLFFFC